MFKKFFKTTYKNASFEDMLFALKRKDEFVLINTLPATEQECLIKTTLLYHLEESKINEMLNKYDLNSHKFIIYGKNSDDVTTETKYDQLSSLGFSNVFLYTGGMFEWILLQDVYGADEFPTTCKVKDILTFRSESVFDKRAFVIKN
jgi:hypothetical protein